MQLDGIFIAQAMRGQREAYNLVSVNCNDTAAPRVAIAREFEYGCDAELGQLPLGCIEKWFGFGEFLDGDNTCV